ncbi:MAG: fibronectin type III domain-containing protein [Deltaproteobacteria bacterium]|nr:fibronectin type III domain-containing protein [Deltaproteobacteria bacterium]
MKTKLLILAVLILASCIKDKRPNAPTDLRALLSSSNYVELYWNDNSNNESYFRIEKNGIADTTTRINYYIDREIQSGLEYTYQVWAVNEIGESGSNIVTVMVLGPPDSVQGFDAIPGFTKIKLTWDLLENVENYIIVRDNEQIAELPASATTFTDTTVELATSYVYIIYGKNSIGLGPGNLKAVKTLGRWGAIWNPTLDYIGGGFENGYAVGYRLYLIKDGLLSLIYDGPDTTVDFVCDYYPCAVVEAYDGAGNVSDFSEVECIEK